MPMEGRMMLAELLKARVMDGTEHLAHSLRHTNPSPALQRRLIESAVQGAHRAVDGEGDGGP